MHLWHCDHCGREWKTEDPVTVHFHRCRPRERQRGDQAPSTLEEQWLRAFRDAFGGYTPPTPEEARGETGEKGAHKRTPRFGGAGR